MKRLPFFLAVLVVSAAATPAVTAQDIYPADQPRLFPLWNRMGDVSPVLRSVEAVEVSADGRFAVSGGKFGYAVMYWRVADGALLWTSAHDSEVECVALSPDGRWAASGGEDYYLRIWSTDDGREVARFEHPAGIDGMAWSHDGRVVATGDEAGTLRVFDGLTPEDADRVREELAHLTPESPAVTFLLPCSKPNDGTRWEEWTDRAVFADPDPAGARDGGPSAPREILEYQAVGRDVTERVNLEARRRERAAAAEMLAGLSPREREVLGPVAEGLTNKVIARRLGVRERTIEKHRGSAMRKLRVKSAAELVRIIVAAEEAARDARDAGLAPPPGSDLTDLGDSGESDPAT